MCVYMYVACAFTCVFTLALHVRYICVTCVFTCGLRLCLHVGYRLCVACVLHVCCMCVTCVLHVGYMHRLSGERLSCVCMCLYLYVRFLMSVFF